MAQAYIDKNTNCPGMDKVRQALEGNRDSSKGARVESLFKSEHELRQNQSVLFPDLSLLDK